jgi:hypothetical protein
VSGVAFRGWMFFFYLLSLGSIIFGIVAAYFYPEYDSSIGIGNSFNHIVGGDAYNYTIMATRGLLWVCVGLTCAVIGASLTVCYYVTGKHFVEDNRVNAESPVEL